MAHMKPALSFRNIGMKAGSRIRTVLGGVANGKWWLGFRVEGLLRTYPKVP